jgi:hypothetical protein
MFTVTEGHDGPDAGRSWRRIILFGSFASFALVALVAYLGSGSNDAGKSSGIPKGPVMLNTPYTVPGIQQPATVAADKAHLDESAEIIGVSAGGKDRAYVVRGFDLPVWHVVNDLLGDVPVTVTYCDRCDFAKVFSGREHGAVLEIAVGGWVNNRMMLRLGNLFFMQDKDPTGGAAMKVAAVVEYPHQRTTWKEWKTVHPETDVYLGSTERQMMEQPGIAPQEGEAMVR